MIRQGLQAKVIFIVIVTLAVTVWCVPRAGAQEPGLSNAGDIAEATVEVIKKDARGVLYTQGLSFKTTSETVALSPEGHRTTITGQSIPFRAVVKYRVTQTGGEGETPLAIEIRMLGQQPE